MLINIAGSSSHWKLCSYVDTHVILSNKSWRFYFRPLRTIEIPTALFASSMRTICCFLFWILLSGDFPEPGITWALFHNNQRWGQYIFTTPVMKLHYNDFIMSAMASQITSLTIVYSTVYSGADQKKLKSSVSLSFVREIHRWQVNSPHKGQLTWKMFPFDDVIMWKGIWFVHSPISPFTECT